MLWQAQSSLSASASARLQITSAPALWHVLSLSNDTSILSNSSGLGIQSIWQALSISNEHKSLKFFGLTSSELVKSPILWFDKLRACQMSNSMVWQAQSLSSFQFYGLTSSELVKSPILWFNKLRACQISNSTVWQTQSLSNLQFYGLTSSELVKSPILFQNRSPRGGSFH